MGAQNANNDPHGHKQALLSSLLDLPIDKLLDLGKDSLECFFDMRTSF
jgi:hypothetical protein